ncbi:MAG: hypothetical protein JXQ87_17060 [Bacteroidia bacterium]
MRMILLTAISGVLLFISGCAENEFSPEPNAVVIGEKEGCGWLIQYLVVPEDLPPSAEHTYWTPNLRKLYREEGKRLILQARAATDAELVTCESAKEKGYEQIVIVNAVQYSNTGVYHNNQ